MRGTRKRLSSALLGATSLLALAPSFYANAWGVARQAWFEQFQRGTECHVIGRLVQSRQDGLFSAGGLLGVGVVDFEGRAAESGHAVHFRRADLRSGIHRRVLGEDWPSNQQADQQYAAYLGGQRFQIYSPYLSQSGGQGLLFGALDAALPGDPATRLALFRGLTALLSAAALGAIALWFAAEFSPAVGFWVMLTALASQWLTGFGGKLWWSLWAFYLPLLVVGLHQLGRRRSHVTLGALAFAAVLAKCLVNGYEYLTSTLVMMALPLVYRALREGTDRRDLFQAAALAVGSAVAIAASLVILVAQVAALTGTTRAGLRHIATSLAVRSQGFAGDFPASYAQSLNASHWEVLAVYLSGPYLDLKGRWPALDAALPPELLAVRYTHLLALFAAASLVVWRRGRGDRPGLALLATTWLSALAPLSWLVVFKAHSQDHTHMNFVVWQMPFTLLGFGLSGVAARLLSAGSRSPAPPAPPC